MKGPLSRALLAAGQNDIDVAAQLGVDPKTVKRVWDDFEPYRKQRAAATHSSSDN